jgi:murein L,D-transpeptidase YcbB/YkuD
MKRQIEERLYPKLQNLYVTMLRLLLVVALLAPLQLKAAGDTSIVSAIRNNKGILYYPHEVARFYQQNGFQLAWIAPDTVKTHAWDAMLLLDCVRQYGLSHEDYHPKQLLYDKLHSLIEQSGTNADKAAFDIILTDAMIRFINDLHYGKLNPVYTKTKIDAGANFKADDALLPALKRTDFLSAINDVQPKSRLYFDLQYHMRLLVGLRSGDCYVIPEGVIRKMAINMERLRWISTTGKPVHLTCIVQDGIIINYKDVYNKDKDLERALYNENKPAKKKLIINKMLPEKL